MIISMILVSIGVLYVYKNRLSSEQVRIEMVKHELEHSIQEQLLLCQGWKLKWDEIKLNEKIGVGASGTVYRANLRNTLDVAVKVFKKKSNDGQHDSEIATMRRCRHPRLVLFLGNG